MQAIFIISIFTMVMAIMASMISNGTSNATLLTDARVRDTNTYFEGVAKVVTTEMTHKYLEANPNSYTTIADYLKGTPQASLLVGGGFADASLDAWGNTIGGAIVEEYQALSSSGGNNVLAPITGFVLVSGGPDGKIQTVVPKMAKLSAIYGMVPAGDDIVYTFDNRRGQEENLAAFDSSMRNIGTAALKELQTRLTTERERRLLVYQTSVTAGLDADIETLNLINDPKAPKFIDLSTSNAGKKNRFTLGVDEEFNFIERKTGAGNLIVSASAPKTLQDPLILQIVNGSTVTPWGKPSSGLKYQISVFAVGY